MHTPSPLSALRQWLQENKLDGMIVPRADAGRANTARRMMKTGWLTGFDGSAGLALVLKDKALLLSMAVIRFRPACRSIWMK